MRKTNYFQSYCISKTVTYSGMSTEDIDGIYRSEAEEYGNRVIAGKEPFDISRLEELGELYAYLEEADVSKLCRLIWEENDSRILCMIAPYMEEKDVSECFRYLLERGKIAESDWEEIFIYSDADLSAKYLVKALRDGKVLTDAQLREIEGFVSEKDFYRIVEYNGKKK